MKARKLHALGACLISVLYPILALVFRDSVVAIILLGPLALGLYRYVLGLRGMVKGEAPPDIFSCFFRSCNGRVSVRDAFFALVAVILFMAISLLPVRILLDFSMPMAKVALFIPTAYCIVTTALFFAANRKER